MATYTIVKKSGAPAGTITTTVAGGSYVIDDLSNTSITTTDPNLASQLVDSSPYLKLQGTSGTFTPAPVIEDVFVADGVLSSGSRTSPHPLGGTEGEIQRASSANSPAELIDAPRAAEQLSTSYSSSFFPNADRSDILTKIQTRTTLGANVKLQPWDGNRVRYFGGVPLAWTSAGYGTVFGVHSLVKRDGTRILDSTGGVNSRQTGLYAYDVRTTTGAVEFVIYGGSAAQYYRIWVNGQPHQATQATITPVDGACYLLKLSGLPTDRDRVSIMFEGNRCLFGGIVVAATDSVLPPTSVGSGPALLTLADSYGVAEGLEAYNAYGYRLARRLGFGRLYNYAIGGTGIRADGDYNPGNIGPNYLDRVKYVRSTLPDDISMILVQGSTNDGNFVTTTQAGIDVLNAQIDALLDYLKAQWPKAQIVMTSTMRCANPTANDLTVSAIYKAKAASRTGILYVDQIAEAWFSGTGTSAAPAGNGNADVLLQSDASHPTVLGQAEVADRLAGAIAAGLGIPTYWARKRVTPYRARVYNTSTANTASGAATAMAWQQKRYDYGGLWTSTAPTRFTIPEAGTYRIGGGVEYAASSAGNRRLCSVTVNGGTAIARTTGVPNATVATAMNVSGTWELAAGDYVELTAFQDTGASLALDNVSWSEFWIERVA